MIKSRKRVIKSNEMNVITVRLNNHKLAVSVTAQKIRFLLRISSVNVTKFAVSYGYCHIFMKNFIFCTVCHVQ